MNLLALFIPNLLYLARVVKLVDTTDLKSVGWKRLCRFKSGPGHQQSISYSDILITNTSALLRKIYLADGFERLDFIRTGIMARSLLLA